MLSSNLLQTLYCILICSLRKETSQRHRECAVPCWLTHSETFIINFLQNKWLKWEASVRPEVGLEARLQIIWAGDGDRAAGIGDWFGSARDCEYGLGCKVTRSESAPRLVGRRADWRRCQVWMTSWSRMGCRPETGRRRHHRSSRRHRVECRLEKGRCCSAVGPAIITKRGVLFIRRWHCHFCFWGKISWCTPQLKTAFANMLLSSC